MREEIMNSVRSNIKLLVELDPECTKSYNMLVVMYWNMFEDAQDVSKCTSCESITRAFRSLVSKKEIILDEVTEEVRDREEKGFHEVFSNG